MKIVLASNNQHKFVELQSMLKQVVELVPQSTFSIPEIAETGLTFVENALIKARYTAKLSGLPTIADDSGLVVKALNGAPGIYSARYAGETASSRDNIKKLLNELRNVHDPAREAFFYCVLVCMQHENDPMPLICEGKWQGKILQQPQGNNGFGYDPVFFANDQQRSAAELSAEIKNEVSHRSIALKLLIQQLADKL